MPEREAPGFLRGRRGEAAAQEAQAPILTPAQQALADRYLEVKYRPLSWRRRVAIVVLAVGTASVGVLTLVSKPGGAERMVGTASASAPARAPDAASRCAPGQMTGCVGGMATVIVAPAGGAGSGPR